MGKSFRLRLALASAVLAGLALAGFAAAALWQMRSIKIDALDTMLRDQAEREMSRPWPLEHWARHEQNMGQHLGSGQERHVLLLVQQSADEIYRSAHWPTGLDAATLPWPQLVPRAEVSANDAREMDAPPFPADRPPPPEWAAGRPPPFPPGRPRQPLPQGEGSPSADERMGNRREDAPEGWNPPPLFPPDMLPDERPPPGPPRRVPISFKSVSLRSGTVLWRFGLATTPRGGIAMGISLEAAKMEITDLRNAFLLAMLPALGLIGLGAWFLSGRALSPIRRLTATMESVTAKGLDQRIALGKEDQEFRQLIQVFNGMLERLERSFLQASRFSADAAHELKTPLAILQGQIERAMTQCEAGSPVQAGLSGILDEVQRLGTISRKLLLLSLADAGRLRLHITRVDLSAVLEDLLEDAQMLAPQLDVTGSITPGLIAQADAELLRQVLHNLLSNAIKYNLPEGWISINTAKIAGRIEIAIANSSTGIPETDHERIFERFYRADPSHNRQIEGVGLGLSLSREIARAHGGDLLLAESADGAVRFVVVLPA